MPRGNLCLCGISGLVLNGLVLNGGILHVFNDILLGVVLLLKFSSGVNGRAIDSLVLLCGLAGGVLGALLVRALGVEAVDFLLGLGDVL